MTRQEVAAFLGVSEKTINNYVKAGKLPVSYVPGRTSPVASFDPEEVAKFKQGQEIPVIEAVIEQTSNETFEPSSETNFEGRNKRKIVTSNQPSKVTSNLAKVESSQQHGDGANFDMRSFIAVVAEVVKEQSRGNQNLAELNSRHALTAAEINTLFRVPEKEVRNAIKDGTLRSSKVGRSQQVLMKDVEEWFELRFAKSE